MAESATEASKSGSEAGEGGSRTSLAIELGRLRARLGARRAMVIALLPVAAAGVYLNGSAAFLVLFVAVGTSAVAGVSHRLLSSQPVEWVHFGSIISGLLVGMTCTPDTPLSFVAIGALISEIVGKHAFRARGRNLLNPAALGRSAIALLVSLLPSAQRPDVVSSASPLSLSAGGHPRPEWGELLLDRLHPAIGEASVMAVLVSGVIVSSFVVMKREAVLGMLGVVPFVLLAAQPTPEIVGHAQWSLNPLTHVLGSSLLFTAFFFASDPVTTPNTRPGSLVFGFGAGTLAVLGRLYTSIPGPEMFAVLLMNLATPWLDRRFGTAPERRDDAGEQREADEVTPSGETSAEPPTRVRSSELPPELSSLRPFGIRTLPAGAATLELVERSGLRGCGGAYFEVARKWRGALAEPAPRVLVVNGQEGDPESAKDVLLMETAPDLVVGGALIAAAAVGAGDVIIAVTPRSPVGKAQLSQVTRELTRGLDAPRIQVVTGPGEYVGGEESALLEHLEGRRCQPRLRPPFPHEAGLFGRPTVVQNVESVVWVAAILERGCEWFGSPPGKKLVTLSGGVRSPGVYVAHSDMSLQDVVGLAGGVAGQLVAFAIGGPLGGILPPEAAGLRFSRESLGQAGVSMGAGSVRVLVEPMCPFAEVAAVADFVGRQSCGKCAPCRLGAPALAQALKLVQGGESSIEVELLSELSEALRLSSSCGLGLGAPNMLRSLVRHWPDALETHLRRRCSRCG
ncbi:MAG: RnfABCDGE type electron transport complex subunit D [Deltaproteobacteria bacterium]|nr:RnfABCDGE type electron transport complex subunit D [Deltaproteobacteria bacterium]